MSDNIKEVVRKVTDIITIVCPLILTVIGAIEASGVISLLGSWQGWVVTALAGLSTVASVLYNFVTDVYKKKFEEVSDEDAGV